jgi:hypothetical protein
MFHDAADRHGVSQRCGIRRNRSYGDTNDPESYQQREHKSKN